MPKHTMSREMSRTALQLAEGVFSNVIDMSLWTVIYCASLSTIGPASGKVWRATIEADRFLNHINYDVIKHAIAQAKRQGYIKKSHRHAWPEITQAGMKRIASVIPVYEAKRVWDGKMRMISYDIPEKRRYDRRLLYDYLNRLRCARLQDSVWITPYDPVDILRSFVRDKGLEGTIIVSDIGKDGSIGDEDLHALVVRVYNLEKLNARYKEWLHTDKSDLHEWMISYFSIVRDDPQLPFQLLPSWWLGDKVYKEVKPYLRRLSIFGRPSTS